MPSQKTERASKCFYSECFLPKNNHKYLAQMVYLLVAYGILITSKRQFTFVTITMYIMPIMIDLFYCQVAYNIAKKFVILFTIYNVVLCIFCVCGFTKVIADEGDYFSIATMYYSGALVSKIHFSFLLLLDLLVPFVFWITCPNKKQLNSFKRLHTQD